MIIFLNDHLFLFCFAFLFLFGRLGIRLWPWFWPRHANWRRKSTTRHAASCFLMHVWCLFDVYLMFVWFVIDLWLLCDWCVWFCLILFLMCLWCVGDCVVFLVLAPDARFGDANLRTQARRFLCFLMCVWCVFDVCLTCLCRVFDVFVMCLWFLAPDAPIYVRTQARRFLYQSPLRTVVVYGGTDIKQQMYGFDWFFSFSYY